MQRAALPEELQIACTWRSVAWSIVGAIAVVAILNVAAMGILGAWSTNIGYRLVQEKWDLLMRQRSPVEWLVLGDSSCNQGVVPAVLDEELRTTSLNLCTIGDMMLVGDAWMLRSYLQRVGVPRHVVMVHVYDIWGRGSMRGELLAKVPL